MEIEKNKKGNYKPYISAYYYINHITISEQFTVYKSKYSKSHKNTIN